MKSLRDFLKPWWTKLILVVCLTVLTYASVSETILKLNEQGRSASEVCYGPKTITINNGETGKTAVANAINNYLATTRSSSPFSSLGNAGKVFVDSAVNQGVNPLLLFAVTDIETLAGTSSNASMKCGNPFGQRVKDANVSNQKWCCTNYTESCNYSNRWYVYGSGISQATVSEEASLIKANYLDKGITTLAAFLSDFGSSSGEAQYRSLIDRLIAASGSALSCGVTTTSSSTTTAPSSTTITTTVSTTKSPTTTVAAQPSCSFSSSSFSSTPAAALSIGYSTTNATSVKICSSGGSCKSGLATGTNQTWTAKPTEPNTYTMTVTNAAGTSRTCTANVTMPSPSCGFHETSYSTTLGTPKILTFSTWGAASIVEICSQYTCKTGTETGLTPGTSKTWSANPTQSTQYTLKVKSSSGATATCKTDLTLN